MQGYIPDDDGAVMNIVRSEDCFTTCILMLILADGKGGRSNSHFAVLFDVLLLPRCVQSLLAELREMVSDDAPYVLVKRSAEGCEPTPAVSTLVHHELRLETR